MNRFVLDADALAGQCTSTVRRGVIETPHGAIRTPAFVPVAGGVSVQGLTPDDLVELGIQAIAFDGFELECSPGIDRLTELGGLRRMTGWSGPILILSGSHRLSGQSFPGEANVHDYARRAGVDPVAARQRSSRPGRSGTAFDAGLRLPSPQDGAMIRLTPERAIATASALGADLAVALDQPNLAAEADRSATVAATRTAEWWRRSIDSPRGGTSLLQMSPTPGGDTPDPVDDRREADQPFGYGRWFGGPQLDSGYWEGVPWRSARVSVGCCDPDDMAGLAVAGTDLIVSAAPTLLANMGVLYTSRGPVDARNGEFERDDRPIDEQCSCPTCRRFSRAYLRHLFVADELLGYRLAALHNMRHVVDRLAAAFVSETNLAEETTRPEPTDPHE